MLIIKKLLEYILTKLHNMTYHELSTITHTATATFKANSYTAFDLTCEKPGYYPYGVVGFATTGTNSTFLQVLRARLTSRGMGTCSANLTVRNIHSSDATVTVYFHILWCKIGGGSQ